MHLNLHLILHHYGYVGVFFVLMMEMVGIPFPAETTLTISGFEWSSGVFRLFPLLLAAGIGNIVGSTIAFWLGRLLGRPVIVRFGKYVGINNERLDKANRLFHKHQSWIVIIGKFIAGIRVLIPYLAGINKMILSCFPSITPLVLLCGQAYSSCLEGILESSGRSTIKCSINTLYLESSSWQL